MTIYRLPLLLGLTFVFGEIVADLLTTFDANDLVTITTKCAATIAVMVLGRYLAKRWRRC